MSAAEALGLPPGVRFDPDDDELVEFYLLPRALGSQPAVPGIILEDNTATATTSAQHPWNLLTRHRRTDDNEAYFFESVAGSGGEATKPGGRQDRSCGGKWTWVGQKRAPDEALSLRRDGASDGEHVSWGKYSLNLHKGQRKGGSTGWVLHEYTVASPECPLLPVKLCHVSFTGHGQKRQRVPDDDGEGERQGLAPEAAPPPHKRAATGASVVATTTPMPNQELSEARAQNQEQQFPTNYNYNPSSIGHFWSSDVGFSQDSSIILDPSYPDARSNNQEPFAMDQRVTRNQVCSASQSQAAYRQEQFMFMNPGGSSTETHCGALLASDFGSSQEPQAWDPEEQLSLAQLLSVINHEQQHIQSFAPATATADLPLSTDQEPCTTEQSHGNMGQDDDFFSGGWSDLDSFCDTSGIQDDDGMATQTLDADGCRGGSGMSWDRHFFYQQPAL